MKKQIAQVLMLALLPLTLHAKDAAPPTLLVREITYDGTLTDAEARFVIAVDLEALADGAGALPLFEGEVAVLGTAKLPTGVQLVRDGNHYRLLTTRKGRQQLKLELVAKVQRAEPWNEISFAGPESAIARVTAHAAGQDMDLQMTSGTVQRTEQKDGEVTVQGVLGPDRTVSLRWRSKAAEAARKAVVTCDTSVTAQIVPTVIKYTTRLRYEILQGSVPQLTVALPAGHALTRLEGGQIRDWRVSADAEPRVLTVEFIKPLEKSYALTLFTEQTVDSTPLSLKLTAPQPTGIERESGSINVGAEDVVVETEDMTGLRRINAPAGTLAAYQFFNRPFTLGLKLERIQPVINASTQVRARLEESRLLVTHAVTLSVEKAGVYAVELGGLNGFAVADVRSEGLEDWKATDGKLRVRFGSRVLGAGARVDIELEQALKTLPETLVLQPLRVTGAAHENAQIGAGAIPGIQLRTRELNGVREVPINTFPDRRDELLAYIAEQPAWQVKLGVERLNPRVIADIFHLITIGDGLVGGSASIRYAILNQGVQELQVKLPADWKNVDFTGPGIRRTEEHKDKTGNTWTISLQEKAWGGYTLLVTYDYPFDPHHATLALGGAQALNIERETGTIAVMSAASVQLSPKSATGQQAGQVTRIDEADIPAQDRALATRPILLAYRYSGTNYDVRVDVTRFESEAVLQAVADRTQFTTALSDEGQLLTAATFMVKNNDKQFQRFTLPKGANFWSCHVDGQPAKAERDGEAVLVPLPRRANRDRAFTVEIVYEQKIGSLKARWPRWLSLAAPITDMQTTYAEWELYAPVTHELSRFGGNMITAPGTTYSLRDAWHQCLRFYDRAYRELRGLLFVGLVTGGFLMLVLFAIRRHWVSLISLLVLAFVVLIMGSMLLPALNSAREKARIANAQSNLRQIGLSIAMYSDISNGLTPPNFVALTNVTSSGKIFSDPSSGEQFVYAGAGRKWQENPDDVIAFSPTDHDGRGRNVLFSDGHVEFMSVDRFEELSRKSGISGSPGQPVASVPPAVNGAIQPAVAAGIRPIRVDIPRTGTRYTFTKVLNVTREPLTLRAMAVRETVRSGVQGAAALGAFLAGLGLLWWQLHRPRPNSIVVTAGLALVIGSVMGVLMVARLLGVALIAVPPVVVVALIVSVIRWWFRQRRPLAGPAPTTNGAPPVIAALALALLGTWNAHAADSTMIRSATYTGIVREKVAELQATLELRAVDVPAGGVTVPLFGAETAVQAFTAAPNAAKLVRDGRGVGVWLPKAGTTTVQLKFLVKPSGDVVKRQLMFGIPPALASRLSLTIAESEASVEVPTAVSFHATSEKEQTRVDAVFGSAGRVEVQWTPRIKRASEIAATAFSQNHSLVNVGIGVVSTRSVFEYQVTQGELREVRLRLPDGQRLLRVAGEGIRTWRVEAQTLIVELLKGMSPRYVLAVEVERALGQALGAAQEIPVELPHALDVKRETGVVALSSTEELGLSVITADSLQQVDFEEFTRGQTTNAVLTVNRQAVAGVYRFLKPEFTLKVRAEMVQPQVEATVHNRVNVGQENIRVDAQVDYMIKKAGVFTLRLALPADYRVLSVAGEKIAQWTEKTENGARLLEVTFKERVIGSYGLRIGLYRWLKDLPAKLEAVNIQPLGAQKLTGYVTVATDLGVQVKTETFDGLSEVPMTAVGGDAGALAFKFIQTDSTATTPWHLTLATELVESWVRAEVVNWLTLSATEVGLVSGRSVVRYDIQNAPTREFRLKVPATFKNVEITGANIRRKDEQAGEWRIELQSKVHGTYLLTVTWETPAGIASDGTWVLPVHGVEALGVERETGEIVATADGSLQVSAKTTSNDLLRIDASELPDWAGRAPETATLVYRYLRPGYKLELVVQRFEEMAVLQALVDDASFTSVVAEDGQTMTEMHLLIRNNARQYLELTLPAGAEVWSAFVAGQPVRPSKHAGKILVPLERSADGAPVSVALTYVSTAKFPSGRGRVQLVSPAMDVPLKNARWELYLPPEYQYGGFAGTMRYDPERIATPTLFSFTEGEYQKAEHSKIASLASESIRQLKQAEAELDKGNVGLANELFSRAAPRKGGKQVFLDGRAEFKSDALEQKLKKAQGDNVLSAQQSNMKAYVPNQAAQVDEKNRAVAEQQWEKLQHAQEMAVATVNPLRVNLPSRGLRYGFSQALQTEAGKPMTVEFTAANARGISWPAAAGMSTVGLIALWLIVAGVLTRRV